MPEVYVKTLFGQKMLHPDGDVPLRRVDEMRESRALRRALGLKEIPCSEAVGDWLRRMGGWEHVRFSCEGERIVGGYGDGLERMRDLFYETTGGIVGRMRRTLDGTLDFEASCIYGDKRCDEWMYTGEKGSMSYFAFMGRVCLVAELEMGNHSPGDHIEKRIGSAIEFAGRYGVEVSTLRSDSAGYTSEVVNAAQRAGRRFYVRADVDCAVRSACERVRDWREYEVRLSKGQTALREMAAAVHCMDRTQNAFNLVVKREELWGKEGTQQVLTGLSAPGYKYWCIATNERVKMGPEERGEGLTPSEVEEMFNDHCDVENRVKQLKSDAGIGRLPTSEMSANRVYVYIMALLHNLFELFKLECLSSRHGNKRLPTIVREVLQVPGRIVVRGHRMIVDLPVYVRHLVQEYREILRAIAQDVRALPRCASPPSGSQIIFRRN